MAKRNSRAARKTIIQVLGLELEKRLDHVAGRDVVDGGGQLEVRELSRDGIERQPHGLGIRDVGADAHGPAARLHDGGHGVLVGLGPPRHQHHWIRLGETKGHRAAGS